MGLNLKFMCARRKELGLKQSEVAAFLGMSSGAPDYCKYENGVYKLNADMIPKLAQVLKCPISALFTDEPDKPTAKPMPIMTLFEAMTRKLIADVMTAQTGDISPDMIQEIRENVLTHIYEGRRTHEAAED